MRSYRVTFKGTFSIVYDDNDAIAAKDNAWVALVDVLDQGFGDTFHTPDADEGGLIVSEVSDD